MLTFLKIAWRDLWRHGLRSGLTLAAISFGAALLIFFMAFLHGQHYTIVRNAISFFPGYLQVHRSGYQEEQSIIRTMPVSPELINYLEHSGMVTGYSPRLCTETLIQAKDNLAGSKICGVIPENEIRTSRLAQTFFPQMIKLPKGIKTTHFYWGKFLSSQETGTAVIGHDLARNLQVEVGDRISILTQDSYGSLAAGNFKVAGIFEAGPREYAAGMVLVNLKEMQGLLNLPGQVTHLVVMLKSTDGLEKIEDDIYRIVSSETGPWNVENISGGLWTISPHKPNLEPDSPLQLADQELLGIALKRIPELGAFSLRVKAGLKLSGSDISALGIAPDKEKMLDDLFRKGAPPLPGDDWAILSRSLAQKLGLEPGNELVLEGTNYLAEKFQIKLRLAGTMDTRPGIDAYVPLKLLQQNLSLGDNINQILVRFPERLSPDQAHDLIISRLNYEVVPWQELVPDLEQLFLFKSVGSILWLGILLILIAFVFLLTILMSVLERARQFGIMKAIGTSPPQLFLIIFCESVFLGLIGSVAGMVLGAIPSLYFTLNPLNLALFGQQAAQYMVDLGFEPYIYALLRPEMFIYTLVIIFSFVLVMTLFPALKAARTKSVQTLRLQ